MPRPSSFARYDEYADPTAAHRRALRAVPAFRSTGTERRVRARSGGTPNAGRQHLARLPARRRRDRDAASSLAAGKHRRRTVPAADAQQQRTAALRGKHRPDAHSATHAGRADRRRGKQRTLRARQRRRSEPHPAESGTALRPCASAGILFGLQSRTGGFVRALQDGRRTHRNGHAARDGRRAEPRRDRRPMGRRRRPGNHRLAGDRHGSAHRPRGAVSLGTPLLHGMAHRRPFAERRRRPELPAPRLRRHARMADR